MRKGLWTAGLAAALVAGCVCTPQKDDPLVGEWSLRLPYDWMPAGAVTFSRGEHGEMRAFTLYRWSSPLWCADVKAEGNRFSFRHPHGILFRGRTCGERMFAELALCDKDGKPTSAFRPFEGWRNPPAEDASTDDAVLGEPIDLLAKGLDGWRSMDTNYRFCWSFKDGVLSNRVVKRPDGKWAGGGANIKTKDDSFYDFNLEYDVKTYPNSNSGVYLRGRYEIQVQDSCGKTDCHTMGAYYGRVAPSVDAAKPAGEWQHVSVTLYRRRLTVVLNGVRIIDNAPVTGVTGGAIDSCEFIPGPIYLQGDHSDADYRNMILRPVVRCRGRLTGGTEAGDRSRS